MLIFLGSSTSRNIKWRMNLLKLMLEGPKTNRGFFKDTESLHNEKSVLMN